MAKKELAKIPPTDGAVGRVNTGQEIVASVFTDEEEKTALEAQVKKAKKGSLTALDWLHSKKHPAAFAFDPNGPKSFQINIFTHGAPLPDMAPGDCDEVIPAKMPNEPEVQDAVAEEIVESPEAAALPADNFFEGAPPRKRAPRKKKYEGIKKVR